MTARSRFANSVSRFLPFACQRGCFTFISVAIILVAGCKSNEIDSVYGRRRGNPGAESVNGTAVLAKMFELAGHRVVTWRRLSPKLDQFTTIVWFPDDFKPPTVEQRRFLERWLASGSGRTLVYVGRDYDASIDYWKKAQTLAPIEQALEVARRLSTAQAVHDRSRAQMPEKEFCDWFVMRRDAAQPVGKSLSGDWSAGVDVSKCELQLTSRFDVPDNTELQKWVDRTHDDLTSIPTYTTLLAVDDQLMVGRIEADDWDASQLIFVANGSFLLNLGLINHEHRKLAQRLIADCGTSGKVAFLESGAGGPTVYDKEPGANSPTGFEVFTVWPLGVILVHLTALGILACVALFPVFGRPRELVLRSPSDFGQHIEAVGELLEKTGDREYAVQKLQIYQDYVKRELPVPTQKKPFRSV